MTSYVNIFEDMDFMMRLLSGEFDDKIKKGKMKISYAYSEASDEVATTAEPVIDEEVEEVEEQAPKSTDLEKATQVALDMLEGNTTEMVEDDFDSEVWNEAWLIANEEYYSEADDYVEEVSPEGETIITQSNDRLDDFYSRRTRAVESWDKDIGAETNDYVYEDDEVNVNECDVTIMSFAKAFSCMMPRAA